MMKKSTMPHVTIMIPVYNEQATIKTILKRVSDLNIERYELIIVDDSSKDKSPEYIEEFKRNFKRPNVSLHVVTHEKNRGKGAAIQTALAKAKGRYFVIQDADLEYHPDDIVELLNVAYENNVPVVYGSRFMGTIKNMPRANYFANRFYNFVLRRLYKTNITDMHTCYKMVETELLKDIRLTANGFDYAPQLISKLLQRGIEIIEVPISFDGRNKKAGKKINFNDGVDCIKILFKYRFSKTINES